ncbi:hypothetical protein [Algoriphagus aquimarinus]|uniref:hypothetical protein n=1 Tax=Algoriphagus aquimarinus TaxID=237018 RepID=UPI0030D7CB5B|tara:strand:- start:43128 stop:43676 length:549 start_codon:yes stop_codon:yes gene_type:complete
MENFKKTEIVIIVILWIILITTSLISILNDFVIYTSDYLGLIGLIIVTAIASLRPEKSFKSVFVLLLLGLFNLVSFSFSVRMVFRFGSQDSINLGIQIISFVLLTALLVRKREKLHRFYNEVFMQTEEEKELSRKNFQNQFTAKFERLSDKEIEAKLQQDLVPEAIKALVEIKEERKRNTVS